MAHASGQPNFDIVALVQKGWAIVQKNAVALIGAAILFIVLPAALSGVTYGLHLYNTGSLILGGPLALGFSGIALCAARGQSPEFPAVFDGFKRFLPAFLANLMISIPSLIIGMVPIVGLLFIPVAIAVYFVYCLTFFYMYDKNLDFWPAMESSRKTVLGSLGAWVPLWLVVIVIAAAGICACIVGIFVTVPISCVMLALAYEQVTGGAVSAATEQADNQA